MFYPIAAKKTKSSKLQNDFRLDCGSSDGICCQLKLLKPLNPPFEAFLTPGTYSPAGDNGNGLIQVCRHRIFKVSPLKVVAR